MQAITVTAAGFKSKGEVNTVTQTHLCQVSLNPVHQLKVVSILNRIIHQILLRKAVDSLFKASALIVHKKG